VTIITYDSSLLCGIKIVEYDFPSVDVRCFIVWCNVACFVVPIGVVIDDVGILRIVVVILVVVVVEILLPFRDKQSRRMRRI
jgi:hypothetical protein